MRVSFVSWAAAVLGAATCLACGSSSSTSNRGGAETGSGAAGGVAGGSSSTTGGSSTAGGGAGQTSSGGSAGGASTATHFGQIMVQSLLSGTSRVAVSAQFKTGTTPGTEAQCIRVIDGSCVATVCDEAAAGGGPTTLYASAGTITVTSTEVAGSATLEPDATNQYPTTGTPPFEKEFVGGENLQFKASGSAVPAFSGELSVPLALLLSQPLFVKEQPALEVPRSQDLSLVWTRGVKDVYFYLKGGSRRGDGLPGGAYLTCQIPSETGSAVIKASTLQLLAADTQITLLTIGAKVITAGDYSITLATTLPAANPDKVLVPRMTLK